jgi:hypothetical protein
MNLLNGQTIKIGVPLTRGEKRNSSEFVTARHKVSSPVIEPDKSATRGAPFVDDFILEHSLPRLHGNSIEIQGSF